MSLLESHLFLILFIFQGKGGQYGRYVKSGEIQVKFDQEKKVIKYVLILSYI